MNTTFRRIFFIVAVVVLVGAAGSFHTSNAQSDSTELTGWAWSDNVGWISLNCDNESECTDSNYKVTIDQETGALTGYAWSDHAGWLQFGGLATSSMPTAPGNQKVNATIEDGKLKGWARFIGDDESTPPCPNPPCDNDGERPTVDLTANGEDNLRFATKPTFITLSWTVSNADECSASGDWIGQKSPDGGSDSVLISLPKGVYQYEITCSNSVGSDYDSVIILVNDLRDIPGDVDGVVVDRIEGSLSERYDSLRYMDLSTAPAIDLDATILDRDKTEEQSASVDILGYDTDGDGDVNEWYGGGSYQYTMFEINNVTTVTECPWTCFSYAALKPEIQQEQYSASIQCNGEDYCIASGSEDWMDEGEMYDPEDFADHLRIFAGNGSPHAIDAFRDPDYHPEITVTTSCNGAVETTTASSSDSEPLVMDRNPGGYRVGKTWTESGSMTKTIGVCPSDRGQTSAIDEGDSASGIADASTSATDRGATDGSGRVLGASTGPGDGWDGWVSLSGDKYSVDLSAGTLSGFAWGDDVVGWITFNGAVNAPIPSVTLEAKDTSGNWQSDDVTIKQGGDVDLRWSSSNVSTCELDGASVNVNGSKTETDLSSTQTYEVTCRNTLGTSVTDDVEVKVASVTLNASPNPVKSGSSTMLSWSSNEVNSCTATEGAGFDTGAGSATSGSDESGSITASETFKIECATDGPTVNASTTVSVTPGGGGGGLPDPNNITCSIERDGESKDTVQVNRVVRISGESTESGVNLGNYDLEWTLGEQAQVLGSGNKYVDVSYETVGDRKIDLKYCESGTNNCDTKNNCASLNVIVKPRYQEQ